MKDMAMFLGYVLHFFDRWTPLSPEMERTTSLSPPDGAVNATVQEPESALLGQDADLESGILEAPPLRRQPSDQPPVQDVVARTWKRLQLSTTTNRTPRVTGEGEPTVRLTQTRVSSLQSGGSAQTAAKLRQSFAYSFFVICLAAGTLINLFVVRRTENPPLAESPSLIVACASAFLSLISASGIITFDIMKHITTPSPRSHLIRDNTCSWSKLFFWMSAVSLTSTVLSIIASFLPRAYYILTLVLVPTLLLVVVSLSRGRRGEDVLTLGVDDPHKDDMERSFQLAVNMTGFSFVGALGTIIGYHKNYSNRASSPVYIRVSIYFMLGAAITGLVTLLFSRLQRRKDWKQTAVGNAIVLVLVVLAVLIVAATFLGGVLAATVFPVAFAASMWFFFEYYAAGRDLDAAFTKEEEMKLLYTMAMTMMSVSFGAVMTIFTGFLGGESKSGRLETLVFFVVSCFVSSVSLGVVTFRAPKKASVGATALALAFLTALFLVVAALAMVSYVG